MKFISTLSISLLLQSTLASYVHIANLRHDTVEKVETEATLLAKQEESTSSSATTSIIGILPPLGTGASSIGGISLTGHGPAIQPQPGVSNAGTGTVTGMSTGTGPYSNYTNPANNSDVTYPGYAPKHLEVTDYQYTMNGRPRVEIQVKYGSRSVTQTWEVRNGTLHQVHSKSSEPCGSSSTYVPAGTSTPDVVGGGEGSLESTSTTGEPMGGSGNAMGTGTPSRQLRPNAARPGFTGPKFMATRGKKS
ncbi:MAG: hypothetical protein Q9211_006186 [Gyalolechia sp. 1 TL-2023]